MGVVYRARDTRDGKRCGTETHEGESGRHGPPAVRARIPLARDLAASPLSGGV